MWVAAGRARVAAGRVRVAAGGVADTGLRCARGPTTSLPQQRAPDDVVVTTTPFATRGDGGCVCCGACAMREEYRRTGSRNLAGAFGHRGAFGASQCTERTREPKHSRIAGRGVRSGGREAGRVV